MMKKLLAGLCALLLALPLLAQLPAGPARAETPQSAVIAQKSSYGQTPVVTVDDPAFLRWLQSLLSIDSPCEPLENRPAHRVYTVTFSSASEPWGNHLTLYTITHDDLYNRATVTRPDGTVHSISVDVPMMLDNALWEPLSFAIPEAHRLLLQQHGWTIAFRHPHMLLQLPQRLQASRTDPAALHFTWADLFLQDAGYSISPFLGQAVVPYVYTLYESVPRAVFYTDDDSDVRYAMRAVVLESGGQVIGAYLMAYSLDGSNLMSLKGSTAPALLDGMSAADYLLSRLPVNSVGRELAALTPEEVIVRYGEGGDPRLMEIGQLLQRLASGTSAVYDPLALTARPTGESYTVIRKLPFTSEDMYEAESDSGLCYFPQLVYESPETGWKVVHFYNTGY